MASLNKVMLIGNLTRDPQVKFLPNQTAVCECGLAVSRKFKTAAGEQREETAFVDCVIFGKGGEIFSQYTAKGRSVYVEGRLKFDSWEDKNGGGKRSKLSLQVEEFQFLGDRGAGGEQQQPQGDDQRRPAQQQQPQPQRNSAGGTTVAGPKKFAGFVKGQRPASPQGAPQKPYGEEQEFNDEDVPFTSPR